MVNITDWLKDRTVGVWSHWVRAKEGDIMKGATFANTSLGAEHGQRLRYEKRRVGRPRTQWTETAEQAAWEALGKTVPAGQEWEVYEGRPEQKHRITQAALERIL